ncbi:hypothetical protein HanXRQr2_Chr11g0503511 [Helianthus annuus]|uniref:Uncharacterized protein n=1 Tax=Helianthus annuus TaxID=4232 RepID=A0A9K3HR22_HELAN|nr:hypothetical protein HanXRQr2_Chr11g0503511 [Helianthus annuus]
MTMSFWRIRCCVERCTMFIIWECLYSARYRFIRTFFYKREDEELTDEKNYFEGLCTPRCVLELRMSLRINMRKVNQPKDLELLFRSKK